MVFISYMNSGSYDVYEAERREFAQNSSRWNELCYPILIVRRLAYVRTLPEKNALQDTPQQPGLLTTLPNNGRPSEASNPIADVPLAGKSDCVITV